MDPAGSVAGRGGSLAAFGVRHAAFASSRHWLGVCLGQRNLPGALRSRPPRARCLSPPEQAMLPSCRWLAVRRSAPIRSIAPGRCWCAARFPQGSASSGTDPSSSSWLPSRIETPPPKDRPPPPCGRTSRRASSATLGVVAPPGGPLRFSGCELPCVPRRSR